MIEVEIQPHAMCKQHQVAIITTGEGYVYACTYALMDEELTEEFVRREWRECRDAFMPYDTCRGRFVEIDGASDDDDPDADERNWIR